MNPLIERICALAEPQQRDRYARYLATLGEAELKQKLADLLLDQARERLEPVQFWRVAPIRQADSSESADRRELITI